MALAVGETAPDFELNDQTRQPVKLSDYRGKKAVVLVFHPFAFTGICEGELCSIRDQAEVFTNDEVETLSISCDPAPAKKVWAEQNGITYPLLSDFWPHGEVAKAYGCFNDAIGAAERATFVIDKEGVIQYAIHNGVPDGRDDAEYVEALRKIGAIA